MLNPQEPPKPPGTTAVSPGNGGYTGPPRALRRGDPEWEGSPGVTEGRSGERMGGADGSASRGPVPHDLRVQKVPPGCS